MDVKPLIDTIEQNAKQIADSYLSEARARISDLQASCDEDLDDLQEQTSRQAREEGERLEQNLRRLHALEGRKSLLSLKRQLIDEGFDAALSKLRALPEAQMRPLMKRLVVDAATGWEALVAGAINPGFLTPAFVDELNAALKAAGKPGDLRDSGERKSGACGLILVAEGSRTLCTMETLLSQHRQALEPEVAALLTQDIH